MAKAAAAGKKRAPTKSEVFANIAAATNLSKKDVAAVFDALTAEIGKALGKKGPGVFQLPGLAKIVVKHMKATKETSRPDPRNPGQMMTVKAKPARNVVRVRALKGLKAMV